MRKTIDELYELEMNFYNEKYLNNEDYLKSHLHNAFFKYDKTGHRHNRRDILNNMGKIDKKEVTISNFSCHYLGEDYVMVNYTLNEETDKKYIKLSIWKKDEDVWKLYFHQSTKLM